MPPQVRILILCRMGAHSMSEIDPQAPTKATGRILRSGPWLGAVAVFLLLGAVSAESHSKLIEMRILMDGNVRFDGGPELDLRLLRHKLRKMSKEPTPPLVQLVSDPGVSYAGVAKVIAEFQRTKCCKLGFVTNEQYKQ